MNIVCIDPLTNPLWESVLQQYPSRAFHSRPWLQVLTDTYGMKIEANVLLDESGTPQAALPFCRIEDMKGKRIASLPFSDYCDPLVNTLEQWQALTANLIAAQCPIATRSLHNPIPLADTRFTCYYQAKWHGVDLQPDLDTLWASLAGSARRAIQKARNNGVTVRLAQGKEDLRTFFNMHLKVRKHKYHMLAQPYRFFEHIWQQFVETQNGFIMLATYQGEAIAGTFFLEWQDGLYYKFNASSPGQYAVRPNDLMVWEAIQYAKSRGFRYLDFGLSDSDQEGLIRYKRKFASEEKDISFLRYVPDVPNESEKQIRALLPKLTDLFTDESVPDAITEKAGDLLYRYFV